MNFYSRFIKLCERDKISPSTVAEKNGLSNSIITYWKKGATPKIGTIKKIANYFNVPIAYLLGDVEDMNDRSKTHWIELIPDQSKKEREVTFDDFTYAFLDESKELTEENKQKLLEMAKFFKQQQDKDD